MKLFKEPKDPKIKSWSVVLTENQDPPRTIELDAVDSETGDLIASFLRIYDTGKVVLMPNVKQILENHGYDPHEHNNKFDGGGTIIIS